MRLAGEMGASREDTGGSDWPRTMLGAAVLGIVQQLLLALGFLVDSLHVPDGALLASTSFCAHPDMCATGFWQQKSSRGPTDYLMFLPDGTLSERDEYRHQTENEAYRASSYSAAPQ